MRALGGSKSGEGADDDSGELHFDSLGVDGRDELGVGSVGRLMEREREGKDEAVKRKGSGGWEVGCFSQKMPQAARRFLRNWLLVIWGLVSSRTRKLFQTT